MYEDSFPDDICINLSKEKSTERSYLEIYQLYGDGVDKVKHTIRMYREEIDVNLPIKDLFKIVTDTIFSKKIHV